VNYQVTASLNPVLKSFWMAQARNRVLYGGRASSKCLAIGTCVLMFDGSLKAIEEIVTGDTVMGDDSTPRRVLDTARGYDMMYRVSQKNGEDYVVNSHHILSLKKSEAAKNDTGGLMKSGNLRRSRGRYPDHPNILNMNVVEFMNTSDKFKANFKGYKVAIDFPETPLTVDPYFLGVWLGDGHSHCLAITTMDDEIKSECAKIATAWGLKLSQESADGVSRATSWRLASRGKFKPNPLLEQFTLLGLIKRDRASSTKYTGYKRIPECYLVNSRANRLEILAGLVDTDGSYSKDKNSYTIVSTLDGLAEDAYRLVCSLGFRATKVKRKTQWTYKNELKHGECWTISFSGPGLCDIPCRLQRKQAVENKSPRHKNGSVNSVLSVSPIGIGEYAGVTLDGNHLFCLADGTVTHNTWDAAGFAIYLASNICVKIMACRQFQSRIAESVYSTLVAQIDRFGIRDQFHITDTSIRNKNTGSEFIFYGIARNITEIKSTEGVDILWIEEAHALTPEQWKTLEPTIRAAGSQIWIIFNPNLASDFVYKRFILNPPPNTLVRKINYDENQFLSQTMIDIIEAAKLEDYEEYLHVYGGEPRADDDRVVIKRSWLMAAVDGHNKLGIEITGMKRLGFDVADAGEDKCAMIASHGPLSYWSDLWKGAEDELLLSCTRVWSKAREIDSKIVYDAIGVGATSGAKFGELNDASRAQVQYEKFFAGGSVIKPDKFYGETRIKNKDFFANVKAQAWWLVADRLRNTYNAVVKGQKFDVEDMLFIDLDMPNLSALIDELSTPKRDFDLTGKVKVESKQDLSKRQVASPNLADAFIMANLPHEFKKSSYFG
jgi:phage terminase large subunit